MLLSVQGIVTFIQGGKVPSFEITCNAVIFVTVAARHGSNSDTHCTCKGKHCNPPAKMNKLSEARMKFCSGKSQQPGIAF